MPYLKPFFLQSQPVDLIAPMEKKQNLKRERELLFHFRFIVLSSFLSKYRYLPFLLMTCNRFTYMEAIYLFRSLDTTYETAVYVHIQIYFSLVTSS